MNLERFPAMLRQLRIGAGLTQDDLAERVGVKRDAVARWEAGRREPSWGNILALASALGVSCEAFTEQPTEGTPSPGRGRPKKEPPIEETKPAKRKPKRADSSQS